jgi:alkanesulfonate monooxygenase
VDPSGLTNVAQLAICVDTSYERADRRVLDYSTRYFDAAPWSESTHDSAIRGTPEQCADQIAAHVAAGVQHFAFMPCDYASEQVEQIAELLPQWRSMRGRDA